MRRRLLVFAAVFLILVLQREFFSQPHDMRTFDPQTLGKLDTDMWRSYYERHQLRLFWQLIGLLRNQYEMPPLTATLNTYRAAHAAFVFKDGKTRADYEKALPDLEAFYQSISAGSTRPFDAGRAAKRELEWWVLHRDRSPQLADGLADLQSALYGIPKERFAEHARLRADAMVLRDDRNTSITEADWTTIGGMLDTSWKSLHQAVQ